MDYFFYYTGIMVWLSLAIIVSLAIWYSLVSLWDRELRPSLYNLWFALSGRLPRGEHSYYAVWRGLAKWHYRYYTRGNGNRHYARWAMRRLVYEARKESKQKEQQL